MVVNYANAIKLGGDKTRALTELHKIDWSASDGRFRISVAAVEGNLEEVLGLMPAVIKSESVSAYEFRNWPVFRPLRGNIKFQEAFKKYFKEELVIVPPQSVSVLTGKGKDKILTD